MGIRRRIKKTFSSSTNFISSTINTGVNLATNVVTSPISTVKNSYEYLYTMARVITGQVPNQDEECFEEVIAVPKIVNFDRTLSPVNPYYWNSIRKVGYNSKADPLSIELMNLSSRAFAKISSELFHFERNREESEYVNMTKPLVDLVKVELYENFSRDSRVAPFTNYEIRDIIKEVLGPDLCKESRVYFVNDIWINYLWWSAETQNKFNISVSVQTPFDVSQQIFLVDTNMSGMTGIPVGNYFFHFGDTSVTYPHTSEYGVSHVILTGLLKHVRYNRYVSYPRIE